MYPSEKYLNITDVTLREGDQAPLTSFTATEKSIIALMLSELGVDVIEVGFGASRVDKENIKQISKYFGDKSTVISSLGRSIKNDTCESLDALKDVQKPRIHIFLAMSKDHIKGKFLKNGEDFNEKQEKLLGQAKGEIKRSKDWAIKENKNLEIEFSPEDATGNALIEIEGKKYFKLKDNPDFDFLVKVCEEAILAGASVINVPDTLGNLLPHQTYDFFKELKSRLNHLEKNYNFSLSCHIHNDLAVSTANAIEAARGGADYIESTLLGIGERAGNTTTEQVIGIIGEKGHDLGINLNPRIITELVGPVSDFVKAILGYDKTLQSPFIGALSNVDGSGVHNANADLYGGSKNKDKYGGIKYPNFFSPRGGANQIVSMLSSYGIDLDKGSTTIQNITKKAAEVSENTRALFNANVYKLYLEETGNFEVIKMNFNDESVDIIISVAGEQIEFKGNTDGENGIIKTFIGLINNFLGGSNIEIKDLLVKSRANIHQEYEKFEARTVGLLSQEFKQKVNSILEGINTDDENSSALAISQVVLDTNGKETYSMAYNHNTTHSHLKAILEGALPLIVKKVEENKK